MSPACRTPASVGAVVQSLPGARHLLTATSGLPFLAQQHFCFQSAGGSHIPAQPSHTVSHLTLGHRHRDAVAHSFQKSCAKTTTVLYKSLIKQFYLGLKLASGYLRLICRYSFTLLVFERAEFSPRPPFFPPNLKTKMYLHSPHKYGDFSSCAQIYELPGSTDTGRQCLMECQFVSCPGAAKVK